MRMKNRQTGKIDTQVESGCKVQVKNIPSRRGNRPRPTRPRFQHPLTY